MLKQRIFDYQGEATKILQNEGILTKYLVINDEKDFINYFTRNFPLDSSTYEKFRKVVGKRYRLEQKDEYIMVTGRNVDDVSFMKRSKAEYNPGYVQIVVSCIPILPNGDILLQYAQAGDMLGYTTLISGHVTYSSEYLQEEEIENFLIYNVGRELYEETGLFTDNFEKLSEIFDENLILTNPESISCYHMANVYTTQITEEQFLLIRNEKGLEARRYSKNDFADITNPDPWVVDLLKYFR